MKVYIVQVIPEASLGKEVRRATTPTTDSWAW